LECASRVATRYKKESSDIWIFDLMRDFGSRLTTDPARAFFPVWSSHPTKPTNDAPCGTRKKTRKLITAMPIQHCSRLLLRLLRGLLRFRPMRLFNGPQSRGSRHGLRCHPSIQRLGERCPAGPPHGHVRTPAPRAIAPQIAAGRNW